MQIVNYRQLTAVIGSSRMACSGAIIIILEDKKLP
jgi:hypothetical protein